jgi:GH43 family beta-xylosidase
MICLKYLLRSQLSFSVIFFVVISFSCGKKSGGGPTAPATNPPANTFTNPLLSSGPDPWIIQKDTWYYYTHTLGNRIAIWKTSKVSELKSANQQTVWTAPSSGGNSKNVWAPEMHLVDEKWYMYYTAGASADLSTQRLFVLENANADPLTSNWVEKGQIGNAGENFFAIDGTVFTHNGNDYLIWSGHASATDNTQRLYIAKMSNPWTLESARSLISSPEYPWEKSGEPPAVNEAPEILRNSAGKIFLVYSASGCWTDDYALGMLTLKEGGDPLVAADWTKSPTPVFSKNVSGSVYGPGHNSFFKSRDGKEDWILYHANSASGKGCTDARAPRMQKFTWNADGTPNFGTPVNMFTNITRPSGE